MTPMSNEQAYLASRMRSGADWFFWLAGLSLVNVLISYFKGGAPFLFGLGVANLVMGMPGMGIGVAIGVNVVIIAIFCALGYFARNGNKLAFLAGMALYLLDAGVCVVGGSYLSAAIHAYVLWRLFTGFQAAQQYSALVASANAGAFDRSNQPPQPGVWPPPPNV